MNIIDRKIYYIGIFPPPVGGVTVKNKDLWMKLYELSNIHNITFNKVKGHSDDELNNRCDELARAAIKNL